MKGRITIMSAVASNGIVGVNNSLPWRKEEVPRDLPHFGAQTKTGATNALVTGRKTFESFGGKPLPGRTNIVVSKSLELGEHPNGIVVFPEISEAVDWAAARFAEVFLIGGNPIWTYGLNVADRALITRIHKEFDGDTVFPLEGLEQAFTCVYEQQWKEKEEGKISSTLQVWVRN